MNQEEQQIAEYLHFSCGVSGRKIASLLDKPKSTINDHLKRLREQRENIPDGAKILIFDIETAPNIGYYWSRWKTNIGQPQVIQESFMLTWCAKWLGSDEIFMDSLHYHSDEVTPDADEAIVKNLWKLIDEATTIVAHNNDRFDEPTLNTRALYHGLQPPHPSKRVDTLKVAKANFRFPSNSMDGIMHYLGMDERKSDTGGFSLWSRCMDGDTEAFEQMLEYNAQDVVVLEQLYMKLRPWDRRHPNIALFGNLGSKLCGCCGSARLERTGQFAYTNVSKFPTYRCMDCGTVKRSRKSIIDKEDREDILMNVAR